MLESFSSDGVAIAYRDESPYSGGGDPILLIHGFASNHRINWIEPSWVKTLTGDGRRVIAIDNRGHGESEKLYDPAVYGAPEMAEDARRLLDHLKIERADVMGYSMGARITAFLTLNHPDRVRSAVFGGLGKGMVTGFGNTQEVIDALLADDIAELTDPVPRAFRLFAESTRADLKALAACMAASRQRISEEEAGRIPGPVLVATGSRDPISGSGAYLAGLIKGARAVELPGKDHMSAVGSREFKDAVLQFLSTRP